MGSVGLGEVKAPMGRGRGRRRIPIPVVAKKEVDDVDFWAEASVKPVENASLNGVGKNYVPVEEGQFDDVEYDCGSVGGSSAPKGSDAGDGAVVDLKMEVGVDVAVPDKVLKKQAGFPIVIQILSVDLEQEQKFGNGRIKLMDYSTDQLRQKMAKMIEDTYASNRGTPYLVQPSLVTGDKVFVVKDKNGNLHRAVKYKTHPRKGVKFIDVDTNDKFVVKEVEAFHMTDELAQCFFQVIACQFEVTTVLPFKEWLQKNKFVFQNEILLQRVLLNTLDVIKGKLVTISTIEKPAESRVLSVYVNVFGSPELKQIFLHSLLFATIPRMPMVGKTKVAFITNVRDSGCVDVVFADNLNYEMRRLLNYIQMDEDLFSPQCSSMTDFFKEMIYRFKYRYFIATMNDDWSELHRVKVLEDADETKFAQLLYLDIGKKVRVPINDLSKLALPACAQDIPELLELVPPQAVTVRLNGIRSNEVKELKKLQPVIEGMACYVKSLENESDPPCVEIFAAGDNKIRPLIEIIRDAMHPDDIDIQFQPNEFQADLLRTRQLTKDSMVLSKVPLDAHQKRLEECKQNFRG